jgi:phosphoribosylformylglycinamidine cyclo-ligase
MEIYLSEEHAARVIEISKSFHVDAQIIGHVEKSYVRELVIESEFGRYKFI